MKSRIIYTLLVHLCLIPAVHAQSVVEPEFDPQEGTAHEVKLFGNGYYLSSGTPIRFMSKFTKGGFIDSTLKSDVLSDLRKNNRIGAEIHTGVEYYAHRIPFFKSSGWSWYFGASYHMNYNAAYSKNLFQLAFFGNRGFAGQTVELGPLNANVLSYGKLSAGAFNKETKSRIALSLVAGQQFSQLNVDRALFYTAGNGSQLDLDLSEQFRSSDTSHRTGKINGWGSAADFVLYFNTGSNKSLKINQGFRVALEDFGFIRWNANSITQKKDSAYRYEGFEVTDLLNGINQPFNVDNLNDTLGIKGTTGAQTHMLPLTFSVAAITETFSDKKVQAFYGFRLRALSNYTPMIHLGMQFNPIHDLALSLYGAFGGYGGFRAGLSASGKIGEHIRYGFCTGNIAGWISKNAYGRDLSLTISTRF
ncbi:MAG TPA: hypothetical protein DEP18_08520 [Flavobacteriales bacterium]|nr:hypothetical protein [Flavobacteriales bacterium]HCA83819.1 hypothetical protein [Flavobacteriales bacterium]HRE73085.1 DUF5723 family protein [Flavobacteriales bacterium]HRJ36093.1 DUF5723 family protein [Flavobacteriales bacterium]HRJ37785.1 DUF5723 family protein [Flavobacteriales bacterium]